MTQEEILAQYGPREAMEYDVVVVGAGPGGLATAIRLKQLAAEKIIFEDPFVQSMMRDYGAKIVPGSIKPIDPSI